MAFCKHCSEIEKNKPCGMRMRVENNQYSLECILYICTD